MAIKTHNWQRSKALLKEIRGKPLQDCTSEIQTHQREAVLGNQLVGSSLAEIIGAQLREESVCLENTVTDSRLLLGAATMICG